MLYIRNLTVTNFIPFMTGGITELDIDFHNSVNIVTGQNGCGKSSLFGLMSPYPKTKSDFKKGTCKLIIEDTDTGGAYVSHSDFKKTGHNHSLINNINEELNISGTTNVQQELIVEHLGWNNVVDKVIHGRHKLCDMSRVNRRSLFIDANPVDISFVLDHYKKVAGEIRIFKNQLKHLTARKLSLLDKILPAKQLDNIRVENASLYEQINLIDKITFSFEQKIIDIKQRVPERPNALSNSLVVNAKKTLSNMTLVPNVHGIDDIINKLLNNIDKLEFIKNNYVETAIKLKNELNTHDENANIDINTAITEYQDKILGYEDMISKIVIEDIPMLDKDKADNISKQLETLSILLDTVRECEVEILSLNEIERLEQSCELLGAKIASYVTNLRTLQDGLVQNERYLTEHRMSTFPSDCEQICSLRSDVIGKENRLLKKIDEFNVLIALQNEKIHAAEDSLESIRAQVSPFTSDVKIAIKRIRSFLDILQIDDYLLDNRSFIDVLTNDPIGILNRTRKLISNSLQKDRLDGLFRALESARFKLSTLCESRLKTIEFTTKAILTKQNELWILNKKITKINTSLKLNKTHENLAKTHKQSLDLISDIKTAFDKVVAWNVFNGAIQFYEYSLNELLSIRNAISTRLVSLSAILKEQDNYITRLDCEIDPQIKELEDKLYKWELVVEQIAPTAIPHQHIRVFTNKVINIANVHLRSMWTEPLKIHKFPKDADILFDFKLTVKDSIVPDISECSSGQQNAINLAFQLALYEKTGWNKRFPIFLDEVSANMSEIHKSKVLDLLITLIRDKKILQLFLIDHNAVSIGFQDRGIICLSDDPGGMSLPDDYNEFTTIK